VACSKNENVQEPLVVVTVPVMFPVGVPDGTMAMIELDVKLPLAATLPKLMDIGGVNGQMEAVALGLLLVMKMRSPTVPAFGEAVRSPGPLPGTSCTAQLVGADVSVG